MLASSVCTQVSLRESATRLKEAVLVGIMAINSAALHRLPCEVHTTSQLEPAGPSAKEGKGSVGLSDGEEGGVGDEGLAGEFGGEREGERAGKEGLEPAVQKQKRWIPGTASGHIKLSRASALP
mmetsp:Transcript_34805/g.98678  ORF Transcript_34805/g.98678 Transcript_34805/m.98678 type:complete len:124 (+) Transcript_34805:325-696(+)